MHRRSWHVALYQKGGRVYYPLDNIHTCVYSAAKRFKEGPVFVGQFIVTKVNLNTDIVDDLDEAWNISRNPEDPRSWVDQRSVKVGTARLIRTRPVFDEWSLDVEFLSHVEPAFYERWLDTAGRSIGLGDYRLQRGGLFGRFRVVYPE